MPQTPQAPWAELPVSGPILRPADAARYVGLGLSTFYNGIAEGSLPPLIKIGPRASGVPRPWLDAVLRSRALLTGVVTRSVEKTGEAAA